MILLIYLGLKQRSSVVPRERLNCDIHFQRLLDEGQFRQYYRMSYSSFETLLRFVAPFLAVDSQKSMNRTGIPPASPANQLQATLSWLGGGRFHEIRSLAGISKSSFYLTIYRVMEAICQIRELDLVFPTTPQQITNAQAGFTSISSGQVITGCVGAIDGWLCSINPLSGAARWCHLKKDVEV